MTLRLTVDAFGHDTEEDCVEWSGGHLDDDTLIVTIVGASGGEEERFCHYRVDARTSTVPGEFDAQGQGPYDLQLLGDGALLTGNYSRHPRRRTAR